MSNSNLSKIILQKKFDVILTFILLFKRCRRRKEKLYFKEEGRRRKKAKRAFAGVKPNIGTTGHGEEQIGGW